MKSDCLTPKDGDKFSLNLRDLQKSLMALFSRSGRFSVKYFCAQRYILPGAGRILLSKFQTLTSSTVEIISLTYFLRMSL